MNKIRIVFGDWSNDGHGQTDTVIIESNYTLEEIQKAYKESCKKTEIKFEKRVASSYDDNSFPFDEFKKLGCDDDTLYWTNPEYMQKLKNEGITPRIVDSEHILTLMMWFCGLSLHDLEWNIVEEEIPKWNTEMGYGLFH